MPQNSQKFPVQPTQPSNEITEATQSNNAKEATQPATRILQFSTFQRESEDLNSYDAVYEVRGSKVLVDFI